MELISPSFKEGDSIPVKFTCDGADLSPELHIVNVPATAKSLVLICDDPDAPSGNWVHWVLYNIPPEMTVIPENVLKVVTPILKARGKEVALMQGKNDFGKYGYGGPCPPHGAPHRYFFRLYALDSKPVFNREETVRGITKKTMLEKIKGLIVAEAVLMAIYQRR
ncbi:MAG: YbhB/YbcL family Raf kinase inhibitor-like protein [bacterium]